MGPVIALVGCTNVGKSTLFNQLTRTRDALVADQPGLTRDRIYGVGHQGDRRFVVVDTGGLEDDSAGLVSNLVAKQSWSAVDEADVVLFLVDGKNGISSSDEMIADRLRRIDKPIILVVNKTENVPPEMAAMDFQHLTCHKIVAIAASHGKGVPELVSEVLDTVSVKSEQDGLSDSLKITVLGRPNVGKSTLINRVLGEDRVVVFDEPGTTRDSVFIPFEKLGKKYTLIDTAGVRRRGKVRDKVEKFSVVKTLKAIDAANVVVLVLNAREGIVDQDLRILSYAVDSGRALVLAINKWDGMSHEEKEAVRKGIDRKLSFVDYAGQYFISALHGSGVGNLFDGVEEAYESAMIELPTSKLTKTLEHALDKHQPPLVKGRRIRMRFAHQGGHNPPTIVIHGTQTNAVPASYQRYLANYFRDYFKITGTPLRLDFRVTDNPYKDKKSPPKKKKREHARH